MDAILAKKAARKHKAGCRMLAGDSRFWLKIFHYPNQPVAKKIYLDQQ